MALNNGDIIKAQLICSTFGQITRLVLHYSFDGAGIGGQTITEDLDKTEKLLFDNGANDILDKYRECMPLSTTVLKSRVQRIQTDPSVMWESAKTAAGLEGASATSVNTAGTITRRTARAGRSQVSTLHIGPLPQDAALAGDLTAAYRLLLADLGDTLDNVVDGTVEIGGLLRPCIYHRPKLAPPTPFSKDLILSSIIGTSVRTMRRRTLGLGE